MISHKLPLRFCVFNILNVITENIRTERIIGVGWKNITGIGIYSEIIVFEVGLSSRI